MLSITLLLEESYFLGDDILIKVRLSNNGTIKLPVWLPVTTSGKLKTDIFTLKHENQEIEYHGMTVTAEEPPVYVFPRVDIIFL